MDASFALEDSVIGLMGDFTSATASPVAALPAAPTIAPASSAAPSSPAAYQPQAALAPVAIDHVAAWDAAIAAKRKAGCSVAAATRAVIQEQPALHADYLAEYNSRIHNQSTKPATAPTASIAAWDAAIAAKVKATSCSIAAAKRAVAIEQPELHRAYLAEFNGQARANDRFACRR